ncbi:MAG: tRNA (adenosine(37)-N6)-threonylcarbamoyltransferase complex dimerization subunit type 1 TsaB [Bacteroidetes bacterium]|nr:tRNA (adenosine(37)-N6)-threonylcarbamoyltransferase complex dimerization subunit type 1 TsaB [Bacteroidota bacterium]
MILAFDTSGNDLHIGLFDDDANVLGEFHHIATAGERGVHDSLLAEQTLRLLATHGAQVRDIRRIAYISGPGSFTGLRIGLAFAKGLAFGGACQLVPVVAHRVISECAVRTYPDREFTTIVTPGYEPTTVYVAAFGSAENVILQRINDVRGAIVGPRALSETLSASDIEFTPLDIDLGVLAYLSREFPVAADPSNLEPFYGTDFKPHPSSIRSQKS